jgi:autotransporter-associated beta strand protein
LAAWTNSNDALFSGTPANNVTTATGLTIGTITLDNTFTGSVTMSGANTVNGATTINGGTLNLSSNTGLGTSAVAIGASGTVNVTANGNIGNVFTGTGILAAGSSTTSPTFTNASALNNFTGTFNVNTTGGQKVAITTVGQKIGSGATVNIATGGTLYISNTTTSFDGVTFNVVGSGNTENLGAIRIENGSVIGTTSSVILGGNTSLGSNVATGTINAAISESTASALTKVGAQTLVLGGANTYTGTTTISAGTLRFSKQVSLYNNNTANWTAANLVVNSGTTAAFNVGGTGEFTTSDIATLAALGTASGGFKSGSAIGLDTTNASGGVTYSSVIANPNGGTNTLGLTKLGTGALTLSGANTYTGTTTVSAGTLNVTGSLGTGAVAVAGGTMNLSGTLGTNTANGNFRVGTVTNTPAILNIQAGAVANNRFNLFVGDAGAGTGGGAVYQSGGSLTLTQGAGVDNIRVGSNAGGYGYYQLSGGTLATNDIGIGASLNNTTGVMDVTGGTFTGNGDINIARGGQASSGVLNATGGTMSATRIRLNYAGTSGATAILNVGGGAGAADVSTTGSATLGVDLADTSTTAGTIGVANLRTNGTLTTGIVKASQANPTALLNFNGGTLKAASTNAGANFLTSANIDSVTVYSGGGTIHNNSTNITVGNVLGAATGNGVTSVAVTNGGSGYIGAPMVKFTNGTGNTATGYAVMVDDGTGNGTFKVGSIVITSPGTYTVDPTTVTLTGGGASTAATLGSITTGANTSGGMTFSGSGTTTLSGANTYTGATTINGGTLKLASTGSIASTAINIATGATFDTTAVNFDLGSKTLTLSLNATSTGFMNAGSFTLTNGALALNFSTTSLIDGQVYNLYDAAGLTGSFGSVSLAGSFSGSLSNSSGIWSFDNGTYNFSLDQATGSLTITAVPEPHEFALAIVALLGVMIFIRRRNQQV